MKKILLSLFAVLCTMGAWAQPKVSDAPSNGQWAANTTWHIMYNASNQFLNSSYAEDATGNLLMNNTTASASDEALWCIVGSAEAGYKFYNKAKGADVVLGISGAGQDARATFVSPTSGTHTISFDIVQSAKTDDTYWCMKEHGSKNNYWNKRGNYLAYWNDAEAQKSDNASAFNITPIAEAFHSEAELAEVKSILKVGVGYPKTNSTVYSDLNNLAINKKTKKQVTAMVNAYYASTDIQLPEDGKTYTLSFFDPVGGEHIIAADGKVGTDKTPGKFYCKVYTNVNEETRYAFVAENGTLFCSHGVSSNYNTYKFGYNDFIINPMVSVTSNVDNSTKQDRFGYVYLLADHRHNKSSDKGSVCLQWSANTYDNSAGAHFENTNSRKYTTAIKMTEVVGNQVSENVKQIASTITALVTGKKGIGSAIGQYTDWAFDSKTGSDYTSFETAVNEAAKTKVVEGYTFSGLNKPETNKFYRLKNYASNNYMSGNADNVKLLTNGANAASTIFYLGANNELLSYNSGLYLDCFAKGYCAVGTSKSGLVDVAYNGAKANVITYKNNSYWTYGAGGNNGNLDRGKDTPNHNGYNWVVSEVTSLPVVIGEAGYATFYSPVAVTLPEGLEAYYVSAKTPTSAILTQIKNVIPAETAVILKGTAEQTYNLTIGGTADGVENLLSGTVADTYKTEDAYVLSAQGEPAVVGFYKATKNQSNNTAFLNHGFKAYLPVGSATARFLSFDFGGNETAIDELKGENGNVKTVIYDLSGRRVQGAQKGIYVVNGKVVIK